MNKQIILGLASFALFGAVACGGDDTVTPTVDAGPKETSTSDAPVSTDSGTDAAKDSGTSTPPPVLGVQIDRIGRPAVNTAVNHTFDPSAMSAGMAKDAYNANADITMWKNAAPEIRSNLAIYDGLDTVCGNQLAAGMAVDQTRYVTIAGVLADDRLYVNTGKTVCSKYLAVELNAVMLPGFDTDCGGRTLPYDVIDSTFDFVAGTAPGTVKDGIAADPAKTSGTTFPYLAAAK